MTYIKQVIVLNSDLDISTGKMISQACHASLNSYKKADSSVKSEWEQAGSKKVVLETGEKDLVQRFQDAKTKGIPAYMVKDAGLTEVEPGTVTAAGIGPADEDEIDNITGDLRLVK